MKKKEIRRPIRSGEMEECAWESLEGEDRIQGVSLKQETISGTLSASFDESELDHVTFSGKGTGASFTDTVFQYCDFSNADLDEVSFVRCEFQSCRLTGTTLIRASFRDTVFERCAADYANFSGSHMNGFRFEACRMKEVSFSMCEFQNGSFSDCDLTSSDFTDTPLSGLDLSDSETSGILVSPDALSGLTVNRIQAAELAGLLGIMIKD